MQPVMILCRLLEVRYISDIYTGGGGSSPACWFVLCYTPDWTFSGGGELRKTPVKNAQSENTNNYSRGGGGGVTNDGNSSASRTPNSAPPVPVPAKRGGGGMFEELSNRFGSLKSVSAAERTSPPPKSSTSPSQSPKVNNTAAGKIIAANAYSSPARSPTLPNSQKSNSAVHSDSERLDAIEKKLDKIMAHLCIS